MAVGTGVLNVRRALLRRMEKRAVVMVLATPLLVGATYQWQHAQVQGRQVALDQALSITNTAHTQASALTTLVTAQLHASAQSLARAQARMRAMLGPPLANGRYFGELIAVGANQEPPRLVIDLERYLTGDAALRWQIAHGIPPQDRYEGDHVIENASPAWHTIEIAPTATISIVGPSREGQFRHVSGGLVGTELISLAQFGDGMSRQEYHSPFWITVSGGRLTAIEQEYVGCGCPP